MGGFWLFCREWVESRIRFWFLVPTNLYKIIGIENRPPNVKLLIPILLPKNDDSVYHWRSTAAIAIKFMYVTRGGDSKIAIYFQRRGGRIRETVIAIYLRLYAYNIIYFCMFQAAQWWLGCISVSSCIYEAVVLTWLLSF